MKLAEPEPLLLLTADGREFVLSLADDFEQEVAALRKSKKFQEFLEVRSKDKTQIPLEVIEKETRS